MVVGLDAMHDPALRVVVLPHLYVVYSRLTKIAITALLAAVLSSVFVP